MTVIMAIAVTTAKMIHTNTIGMILCQTKSLPQLCLKKKIGFLNLKLVNKTNVIYQ